MATVSSTTEFTGGGVTLEEGIIWKVSEGLFGSLGMGFELWGAAAASTSVAAATVFKTAKNKKNDQRLRSSAGSRINSTSPPPLSATLNTDPGTITILSTPGNSQFGGGKDLAILGDGQHDLVGKWIGHFRTAVTHHFLHLALFFFPAFLFFKGLFALWRFNWRPVMKEIGIWIYLACILPFVFLQQLWIQLHPDARPPEEPLQTGITNRGIGGIVLLSLKEYAEGKVAKPQPWKPGKVGSGGGGKKSNQKRLWKAVKNKFHDLVFTLNAIVAWVRFHLGTLAAWLIPPWVVKFFDGIGKNPGSQQQSSGTKAASLVGDDNETGGSAPGSDNEGSRKTVKGKATLKKTDNSGNHPRKKNGGGKKKKRRK